MVNERSAEINELLTNTLEKYLDVNENLVKTNGWQHHKNNIALNEH